MPTSLSPTLRLERALLRQGHSVVLGIDEVGRGALAGPIVVGAVMVTARTRSAPRGLADSKQLRATERERLAPLVRRWAWASRLGAASAPEIDRYGLTAALRLASLRALSQLPGPAWASTADSEPAIIIDGRHNFLTPPQDQLFTQADQEPCWLNQATVVLRVQADASCSSVAAAAVLAKVARDRYLAALALTHPGYGWERNRGYGSRQHREAIGTLGCCPHHRQTWVSTDSPAEFDCCGMGEPFGPWV